MNNLSLELELKISKSLNRNPMKMVRICVDSFSLRDMSLHFSTSLSQELKDEETHEDLFHLQE
jgi:hypothetical protein